MASPRTRWTSLCTLIALACGPAAGAQEAGAATEQAPATERYYSGVLQDYALERVESMDAPIPDGLFFGQSFAFARVTLAGAGEAYVDVRDEWRALQGTAALAEIRMALRLPADAPARGTLYLPTGNGFAVYRFSVREERVPDATAQAFHEICAAYHTRMALAWMPGVAWHRNRAEAAWDAAAALASPGSGSARGELQARRQRFRESMTSSQETFAMFSGGRAVAENLRLDRELDADPTVERTVDVSSLPGIEVEELDFSERIAGLTPQLDALAALVPADQHAAFLPSVAALDRLLDEVESYGAPVLQMMEPYSESSRTRQRYERQLCAETDALAQALGGVFIRSLAVTGSDPYFRTGTDLAVLLECSDADKVYIILQSRQDAAAGATPVQGEVGGLAYRGVVTEDRSISSYLARSGEVLLLSNSLVQVERFAELAGGGGAPLVAAPEYVFFRDRYPRGTERESAFLMLTDATIRRWGGARCRIGAARRLHAAATMADQKAEQVAAGGAVEEPHSAEYNTLGFLTPIAELSIDKVTQAEAEAYERFRASYQNDWREYFDPIAASLDLAPERVALDLSVMPMIGGTDYRQFLDLIEGAQLAGTEGDPHESTLFHWVMALDTQSSLIREVGSMASMMAPGLRADPLGWIDNAISVYAELDPFWEELLVAEDFDDFLFTNLYRLPLVLHLEVDDALGLTAFLTALRVFSGQAAPDMTVWETRTHRERSYVRIAPSPDFAEMEPELREMAIHYAALPGCLVLSLREDLIHKAIERHTARRAEGAEPVGRPWLGTGMALRIDGAALRQEFLWQEVHPARASWSNLPILNTWQAMYPDRDPVEVHEELWHVRLLCPGGGEYVWNEEWETMESTLYGHPAVPREGPKLPAAVLGMRAADFGLDFEGDGLRARAVIER